MLIMAACQGPEAAEPAAAARDSAGVAVVVLPDPVTIPVDTVASVDVVAIYGFEDSPIRSVRDLVWTESGDVLLADGGERLVLMTSEGDVIRELGTVGEGPGEFRDILLASGLAGGDALIFDPMSGRVTEFAGEEVRVWSPPLQLPSGALLAMIDATEEGSLIAVELSVPASESRNPRRPEGRWSTSHVLVVEEARVDTVADIVLNRCREETIDRCVPKGDGAVVTGRGRRVAVASRDWAEIRLYEVGARLSTVLRRPDPNEPRFTDVLLGEDGSVWFGYRDDPVWVVREGSGVLRRVAFPANFRPRDVSEEGVVGVTRDELGVERVAVALLRTIGEGG